MEFQEEAPPEIGGDLSQDALDIVTHEPVRVPIASAAEATDLREKTIGASESGALFTTVTSTYPLDEEHAEDDVSYEDERGDPVSPYTSVYALFALKTGKLNRRDLESDKKSDRLHWSRILRPIVARKVAEAKGWRLREVWAHYLHPRIDRMSATVRWEADIDGSGFFVPVEVQIVSGSERWKWLNAIGEYVIPGSVMIRLQHQLAVTGCRRAAVVALFGGYDERVFLVERDEDLIGELEEAVAEFWEHVENDEPPQPDYARDGKVIKLLNAKINPGNVLDWRQDNEAQTLFAEMKYHSAQATKHTNEAEKRRNALWEKLGDASAADLGDVVIGVVEVEAGEVKYFRRASKKMTTRKPRKKHAGDGLRSLTS